MTWPVAALDAVRELRVMAEAMPGVGLVERIIDAPFDEVWGVIEDLERAVPSFDPMVRSLTITSRDGEHLTVRTTTPVVPVPVTFDVLLRSGWCWMQSSMYVVGMAASPLDNRTRYAHLEGVPYRRGRLLRPIMRRIVGRDVDGIVGTVARRSAS